MRSDDPMTSPEIAEFLPRLLSGENIILIGPNRTLISSVMNAVKAELSTKTRVSQLDGPEQSGATHIVAHSVSPERALKMMIEQSQFSLFASMPVANILGVSLVWARELQRLFGERSRLVTHLLSESLKSICCLGVPLSPTQPLIKSAFRENLLVARYNQGNTLNDHGLLLKGWTSEGDTCDPGWELDK